MIQLRDLSDEMLLMIIEYLRPDIDIWPVQRSNQPLWALALVSQHFNRLATSYLYHTVVFRRQPQFWRFLNSSGLHKLPKGTVRNIHLAPCEMAPNEKEALRSESRWYTDQKTAAFHLDSLIGIMDTLSIQMDYTESLPQVCVSPNSYLYLFGRTEARRIILRSIYSLPDALYQRAVPIPSIDLFTTLLSHNSLRQLRVPFVDFRDGGSNLIALLAKRQIIHLLLDWPKALTSRLVIDILVALRFSLAPGGLVIAAPPSAPIVNSSYEPHFLCHCFRDLNPYLEYSAIRKEVMEAEGNEELLNLLNWQIPEKVEDITAIEGLPEAI